MEVPLLDLRLQYEKIGAEIEQAVLAVLRSTRYIGGEPVETLEREIAKRVGCRFGIGCSSGTDALLVSLMACGVGEGDLVITSNYSFFATAGTIRRLGATPVFIDIDPVTFNISPESLRDWLENNHQECQRVKAIMPVHLYGQCADMDAINNIAKELGAMVIEDAAQALGSSFPTRGGEVRAAGSMGTTGCFSFFPSKNLGGIGDGGMVVTDDAELAERIALLRNHGAKPKYYHSLLGGNFRLDALQAAALLVKLCYLDQWAEARRSNAAYYDLAFAEVGGVVTPKAVYGRQHHVYNQYILTVPDGRDELRNFLSERKIGNEVYYPVPFHQQPCFQGQHLRSDDLSHSEYAAQHTIALPIFPELTRPQQDRVVEGVREFYR